MRPRAGRVRLGRDRRRSGLVRRRGRGRPATPATGGGARARPDRIDAPRAVDAALTRPGWCSGVGRRGRPGTRRRPRARPGVAGPPGRSGRGGVHRARCRPRTRPRPAPLEAEHASRVADLRVYVRQHHAERDTAALGRATQRGIAVVTRPENSSPTTAPAPRPELSGTADPRWEADRKPMVLDGVRAAGGRGSPTRTTSPSAPPGCWPRPTARSRSTWCCSPQASSTTRGRAPLARPWTARRRTR